VVSLLLHRKKQTIRAKKQKATPATSPGCTSTAAQSEKRASILSNDFDAVFVQPRSLLFLSGVQHRLCALHGEDVEVGGVRAAVGGGRVADFVRSVEHHVVLPQAARPVEDAQHALLHVHVPRGGAPGERVVPLALGAFDERWGAGERDAVFGVCEALFSRGGAGSGLADCAVAREVIVTPGQLDGVAAAGVG
jgi:hypothetical protein